jgi:predicted nuclease with TOPRIM domain
MDRVISKAEPGSGLGEGSEVTHRDIHVLANALNEHICDMEKDGLYKKTKRNQNKYEKLKQLLENTQEQKSQFERVRPKPKGFGRLRK